MKLIREINHLPKINAFKYALVYDNVDLCKANWYYYDNCGQYIKLPFNCGGDEAITTFTNLVDGNLIGTYINEAGTAYDVKETITSLVNTQGSGNTIGTYTSEDGTIVDINETITTIIQNPDGSYTFTNEAGDQVILNDCSEPLDASSLPVC